MEEVIELRPPVFTEPPYSALVANVYETWEGDTYVIEIPLPGVRQDEIEIRADRYSLTVSTHPAGTERDFRRTYILREHSVRPMWRRFDFPVEIESEKVKASLTHGMLRIFVPKSGVGKIIPVEQAV